MGRDKKRSRSTPFVKIDHYILKTDAYKSLSLAARAVLTELVRRHNGYNNGNICASERSLADEIGCDRRTIRRALKELEHKGFIKLTQKGSFNWKTGAGEGLGNTYSLTWLERQDIQGGNRQATKEFARWAASQ